MDHLIIQESKRTPEISFKTDGDLSIKGRSIPEDAGKFFDPLCNWLSEYSANPSKNTTLNVFLEYFNSGSAKSLLQVIKLVANLRLNPLNQVVINWYYETGDDDILERGQYYSSILNFDFNYFEV